jgi:hypothetical protein
VTVSAVDYKSLIKIDMKDMVDKQVEESHIKQLLEKYKETIVTTIVQQFGLVQILDAYRDGGNVTTVHNAKEHKVFANDADKERFQQSFDRNNYEKDFPKKRKQHFKMNDQIYDDYSGKTLVKDGSTHLDHVVSAHSIHKNDKARLYMDSDQRNAMATDDQNLAWTDRSLNQSKSDKAMDDWMDLKNRKDGSKTNAEYYDVDEKAAMKKHQEAEQHINKSVRKAEVKYYTKNIAITGVDQGLRMGGKQAVGLFMYEFQAALFEEMKVYFKEFKTYHTMQKKLEEFYFACQRVKTKVLSKTKAVLQAFGEGFVGGFVSNLITVFINTFAKTAKNTARMLNDVIHALIKACKLLINPPEGMTRKQAMIEASKILTTAVVASVGFILTESFAAYLKTTPLVAFADLIAGVLGGILTGIVACTLVHMIDNFSEIMKKIGESFKLIQYQLTVSAAEIRSIYQKAVAEIDTEYQLILNRIYQEYEKLNQLMNLAFDCGALAGVQFKHSQDFARASGVKERDILTTIDDIDDFFLN